MSIKSRLVYPTGGCIPKAEKCKKCVYREECKEKVI